MKESLCATRFSTLFFSVQLIFLNSAKVNLVEGQFPHPLLPNNSLPRNTLSGCLRNHFMPSLSSTGFLFLSLNYDIQRIYISR